MRLCVTANMLMRIQFKENWISQRNSMKEESWERGKIEKEALISRLVTQIYRPSWTPIKTKCIMENRKQLSWQSVIYWWILKRLPGKFLGMMTVRARRNNQQLRIQVIVHLTVQRLTFHSSKINLSITSYLPLTNV